MRRSLISFTAGLACVAAPGSLAPAQVTTKVSVDSQGKDGGYQVSWRPNLSVEGRYIAYESFASFDGLGGYNSFDIFLHDRITRVPYLVSKDSAGTPANDDSYAASISGDGRWIAFWSNATNLVANDTNGAGDVFVHDRVTGQTTRASVDAQGAEAVGGFSTYPAISADGRCVAFHSAATSLIPGDRNGAWDIFVKDLLTGQVERVSVDSSGAEANNSSNYPSVSDDGRFVAFWSMASNLVPGDTNGVIDVFVHDRQTRTTRRVSVSTNGDQADQWKSGRQPEASISGDGRFVVFSSIATTLVSNDTNGWFDVFLHDLQTSTTTRINLGPGGVESEGGAYHPEICSNGAFVSYLSTATDLLPEDTDFYADVYKYEVATGQTSLVSVSSQGEKGNGLSGLFPSISDDGRFVGFESTSSNLVPGDIYIPAEDVYVHGAALSLDVAPDSVAAGQLLTFATFQGNYLDRTLLVVSGVDGVPTLFRVSWGSCDPTGNWIVSVAVPPDPALQGLAVDFQVWGLVNSIVELTNPATVRFL